MWNVSRHNDGLPVCRRTAPANEHFSFSLQDVDQGVVRRGMRSEPGRRRSEEGYVPGIGLGDLTADDGTLLIGHKAGEIERCGCLDCGHGFNSFQTGDYSAT